MPSARTGLGRETTRSWSLGRRKPRPARTGSESLRVEQDSVRAHFDAKSSGYEMAGEAPKKAAPSCRAEPSPFGLFNAAWDRRRHGLARVGIAYAHRAWGLG